MGPTAHPAKGNTKPYATSRSGNIRKDLTKDKQEKTKKNPSRNPKNKITKTKEIPEKRPPSALTGERDRTRSHPRGEKAKTGSWPGVLTREWIECEGHRWSWHLQRPNAEGREGGSRVPADPVVERSERRGRPRPSNNYRKRVRVLLGGLL